MSETLLTSPLHERHLVHGAKFAEFAGWNMPIQYSSGVLAEHQAVRSGVGVFDVSHLGKVWVTGPGAAAFVNRCLANDLDRIGAGGAQYTLCLDEDGGVVDDLIAYRFSDEQVFLIPNAANTAEVARRLSEAAPDGVEVRDVHRAFAVIAVQGPESPRVLEYLGLPHDHEYMTFREHLVNQADVIVCRSGYTGETGFELVVPNEAAVDLWDGVLAAGAAPCGLGARDTLRLEMGYPLHGQDLSLQITPVQARLNWAIGWDKPEFWGKDALEAERAAGPKRRLWGLEATGKGVPRAHMAVMDGDDVVGETTSGTHAPTLKKGVALALLDASYKPGAELELDVRGRRLPIRVVKPPFTKATPK
ncbi:glycine cleavage system aminomethyltransferase GcvT [Glycomyces algeriensis]|uniref:Aminomethyltransferase n=1 Tax=Glycomyces algeriensis TaxID=256037 RepID=A0A9W6G8Q6_9ACTN|nr:glycine cleavage system aminomethyltransferase GcvT [Glycomyces algeriensis]MDA1365319.1 glycine cleavage system aminomethyltransferase GcvT [Glycomyces algeriensis]MDR7349617.1 aminomethyltransferase [Glycomyces algeriensis]GLI42324.1 aminomethyltransferase [Glycomyces algeriensis]